MRETEMAGEQSTAAPRQPWDLRELGRMVQKLYGREQRDLAQPCIQSLPKRMDYSEFHYYESVDLMAEQVTSDHDEDEVFMLILGVKAEESRRFREARFKAEAHLLACLQSLHGIADTLAHVVYFTLGMNLDASTRLAERHISMDKVTDKLNVTVDGGDLKAILSRMVGSPDHLYLNSLVNHYKHRSVVQASYGLSVENPDLTKHGLRFDHFTHGGVTHPQRWVRDVLPPQHERLSRHFVEAGHELSRVVLKRIEALAAAT